MHLAILLTNGCLKSDLDKNDHALFETLCADGILVENQGLWQLDSRYRVGKIYINKNNQAVLEPSSKSLASLLIRPEHLGGAKPNDIVIAKRIIASRGRASAKVVMVAKKASAITLGYIIKNQGNFELLDFRTHSPIHATFKGLDLGTLKHHSVLKIDTTAQEVLEIVGNLEDPKIDQTISLFIYGRKEGFSKEVLAEAEGFDQEITPQKFPQRQDLTALEFCTIDPVTAKDFDDAIYFDTASHTLYVAIADVSHYMPYDSAIDDEASRRGFTTYFPHKSFPMIPRNLSENLCSLNPHINRLAFVCKMVLDPQSLEVKTANFFEAVIHSKRRFNYDEIDSYLKDPQSTNSTDSAILKWLMPLYSLTQTLRKRRLNKGFDFRSEEIKISIDKQHLLSSTQIETGTPSHSLIEECMLLANKEAAGIVEQEEKAIFRIHQPPKLEKIEALLVELHAIGIEVGNYEDSPALIRAIQKAADALGIGHDIDEMLIKSLKQASYCAHNEGHFGLGFERYSHFTSPIRRYSDLILHRLIKAKNAHDSQALEHLQRNLEALCVKVSDLERQSTKAEWDFRDRKFARWAQLHQGESFEGKLMAIEEHSATVVLCDASAPQGLTLSIQNKNNQLLFETVEVRISEVSLPQAKIMGELI